jgi:transcriptional regulator NrdR family protein
MTDVEKTKKLIKDYARLNSLKDELQKKIRSENASISSSHKPNMTNRERKDINMRRNLLEEEKTRLNQLKDVTIPKIEEEIEKMLSSIPEDVVLTPKEQIKEPVESNTLTTQTEGEIRELEVSIDDIQKITELIKEQQRKQKPRQINKNDLMRLSFINNPKLNNALTKMLFSQYLENKNIDELNDYLKQLNGYNSHTNKKMEFIALPKGLKY